MVGGDELAFKRAVPVLDALGKNVVYMGPSGSGQATKLCNQVICGLNILAVAEGLSLGAKSGLDPERLLSALSAGAANSWMLSNLAPKMVERDWRPGFKIRLQQKDLRLAVEAASEIDLPLFGTPLMQQILLMAEAMGLGDEGTQSVIKALENAGGFQIGVKDLA
jgi:3-hydroxyisobutyrate dehydrogenase-like beta-hydroxyacid dehydrogenase